MFTNHSLHLLIKEHKQTQLTFSIHGWEKKERKLNG